MDNAFVFYPDRRLGLVFHSAVILALAALGVWGVLLMTRSKVGPIFFLSLLPPLLSLALIPVLAYRTYALYRAVYVLGREGIQLRWGLRAEDIPMDSVEWVGPVEQSGLEVPKPQLRWPGSVVGVRSLPEDRKVEFMASNTSQLVLVATSKHVFAISPSEPEKFLETYQRFAELGSLASIPGRSIYPVFFLAEVWRTKPARYLIITGLALSLILLTWVSIIIPTRSAVPLGFNPDGIPSDLVPAGQLLLFPITNGIFFLADVILGLFLYRRSLNSEVVSDSGQRAYQILAYLLWASGALTALLFIWAVFFILRIP